MLEELKGIEELNKTIEQFFIGLGYPEIECELDIEFAYYYEIETITYSLFENPYSDAGFKLYIEEHFNDVPKCSLFLLSLLHELGHHLTIPLFTKKQIRKYKKLKKRVENKKVNTPKEIVDLQIKYCCLPQESKATKKAIELLKKNYKFVKNFEQIWNNAVLNFYKINNITED